MFMRYQTITRETADHRIRSGIILAVAIALANVLVISGVLFGLAGVSHAATLSPSQTAHLATMLASPDLDIGSLASQHRVILLSLLATAMIAMLGGATALSRNLARDFINSGR